MHTIRQLELIIRDNQCSQKKQNVVLGSTALGQHGISNRLETATHGLASELLV